MFIYLVLITVIYTSIAIVECTILNKSNDIKSIYIVIILCCLGYIMALAALYDLQFMNITRYIYDLYAPLYDKIYK